MNGSVANKTIVALALVALPGHAFARPLTTAALRALVREDRRTTVRQLRAAARRYLEGKALRRYVVFKGELYRKGEAGRVDAPRAELRSPVEPATVHVVHTRRERGKRTSLLLSYGPDTTLSAADHGPERGRAFHLMEGGWRANGHRPDGRLLGRTYAWGGAKRGLVARWTHVSESSAGGGTPAGGGARPARRPAKTTVYVSTADGKPVAGSGEQPGQYVERQDRLTLVRTRAQVRSYAAAAR